MVFVAVPPHTSLSWRKYDDRVLITEKIVILQKQQREAGRARDPKGGPRESSREEVSTETWVRIGVLSAAPVASIVPIMKGQTASQLPRSRNESLCGRPDLGLVTERTVYPQFGRPLSEKTRGFAILDT